VIEIGYSSVDVAGVLSRSPSSVSRWLTEGLALKSEEEGFRSELNRLVRLLGEERVTLQQ
jgi:hypothetical protein